MKENVLVYDLDDTLYKEVDFVKSAFGEIAALTGDEDAPDFMWSCYQRGENVFERIKEHYGMSDSVEDLLNVYHKHSHSYCLR